MYHGPIIARFKVRTTSQKSAACTRGCAVVTLTSDCSQVSTREEQKNRPHPTPRRVLAPRPAAQERSPIWRYQAIPPPDIGDTVINRFPAVSAVSTRYQGRSLLILNSRRR